jgi:hypothetical protein
MRYNQATNPQLTLATVDRLCLHHDHLKALVREYALMRHEETYARMADPTFRTNGAALDQAASRAQLRTSLIVKLPAAPLHALFAAADAAYAPIQQLIHQYDPACAVDIYRASAHITVKTLSGDITQSTADLAAYRPLIRPIVERWLAAMPTTKLYAVGLFSSLSADRGLSLGLRFYPSLPLLQIIRGEVGAALYAQASHLPLRPESAFHTTLTHSTGCRARLREFPLHPAFINDLRTLLERADRRLFGVLDHLTPADFVIRHGYSDQLVPLAEVPCDADDHGLRQAQPPTDHTTNQPKGPLS